VVLVDAGAPLRSLAMIYQMEPSPRRLFLAARMFPSAIKTPHRMVAADFFASAEGEARAVEYFFDGSPADEAIVDQGRNWDITRDNLSYGFRNTDQLIADIVRWSGNASKLYDEVVAHMPIHFFQGRENLVQRADWVETFCDAHPGCTHRIEEGAGQLLIYTHPETFAAQFLPPAPSSRVV
jgi:hypothetical protein